MREYPTATDAALRAAVSAAAAAYRGWSKQSTVAERAALIRRVAELHNERRDELAAIIVREMGKPVDQATGEVEFSAAIYEFYADNAEKFLADEPIELLDGEGSALIRRGPIGVLLGIMPWNYPYYQVARFAGPNLVQRQTVVLKHAPQCPESAPRSIRSSRRRYPWAPTQHLRHQRQVPHIADPRVHGVSLTGSDAPARRSLRSRSQPEEGGPGTGRFRIRFIVLSPSSGRTVEPPSTALSRTPARPATPPSGSSTPSTSMTTSLRSSRRGAARGEGLTPASCRRRRHSGGRGEFEGPWPWRRS